MQDCLEKIHLSDSKSKRKAKNKDINEISFKLMLFNFGIWLFWIQGCLVPSMGQKPKWRDENVRVRSTPYSKKTIFSTFVFAFKLSSWKCRPINRDLPKSWQGKGFFAGSSWHAEPILCFFSMVSPAHHPHCRLAKGPLQPCPSSLIGQEVNHSCCRIAAALHMAS